MDALLFPLLLLIAVVILAGFLKNLKGTGSSAKDDSSALGYRKKGPLLTPAERSFYGVLLQAIDSDKYCVFGKVRVADLLEPQPSRNRSQWQVRACLLALCGLCNFCKRSERGRFRCVMHVALSRELTKLWALTDIALRGSQAKTVSVLGFFDVRPVCLHQPALIQIPPVSQRLHGANRNAL